MMLFVYVITIVLLAAYAFLIQYYHRAWKEMPETTGKQVKEEGLRTTVTVIIPARNEEKDIRDCLRSLLSQDYPAHLREIVVIDDHSEDGTPDIVKEFLQPGVRLIALRDLLPEGAINSYKKKAIETGIRQSVGELILTTDADCTMEPGWLSAMAARYEKGDLEFIAAPVRMADGGRWLHRFQVLDFLSLQGITAASVHKGFHSMSNGANLAYSRKAFEKVEGFHSIDHLASGDDMLLMHKIARAFPGRVGYLKQRQAMVTTQPQHSLGAFFRQRIRWASKAQGYEDKRVFRVLLLVYILNLFLLLVIGAAFFSVRQTATALGFLAIKTIVEWPFMISVARFYGQENLMNYFPLFQPLHILYTVIAGSFGQFGTYEWKGRKVR